MERPPDGSIWSVVLLKTVWSRFRKNRHSRSGIDFFVVCGRYRFQAGLSQKDPGWAAFDIVVSRKN